MTPEAMLASYRRLRDLTGENVTFQRIDSPAATILYSATVKVRCFGTQEMDISEGRGQTRRQIIVLAEDLEKQGFPLPPNDADRVLLRGKTVQVQAVDSSTRRCGDVQIAYDVWVEGPNT